MLIQRWLRIIGLGVWLIAGSTSFVRLAGEPRRAAPWMAAFAAFAVLFWIGSSWRATRAVRTTSLVGQAVCAALLAWLGMPMFEGALFALVAAQIPLALPVWASIVWAVVQLPVLWFVLPRDYNVVEVAKSLSAYLAFAAFAIAVVRLFESERRARVELARVGERVRVSRELHDVLGHHLTALSIQLDVARRTADGAARAPLDEAHGVAQRMLGDVRNTVAAMRSDGVTNLRDALGAVVRAVPRPKIDLRFPEAINVTDPACVHVALRCAQEALTNAVKHADAEHVIISIERDAELVVVTIEDDGKHAGPIRPGSGLRGMRERVEEIGGELEVEGIEGRGTTIRARIPEVT